jgi:hypothetical protein
VKHLFISPSNNFETISLLYKGFGGHGKTLKVRNYFTSFISHTFNFFSFIFRIELLYCHFPNLFLFTVG